MNKAMVAALKRIQLDKEEVRLYRTIAAEMFGDWKAESEKARDELILRQHGLKDRHSRLVDSYMDGIIEKEDYFRRKEKLLLDEKELDERIKGLSDTGKGEMISKFDEFIQLANSAYLSFESAPYELKRETVELVTSDFSAAGKKVTIRLQTAFELLATRPAFTSGSPNREASRTFHNLVEQLAAAITTLAPVERQQAKVATV